MAKRTYLKGTDFHEASIVPAHQTATSRTTKMRKFSSDCVSLEKSDAADGRPDTGGLYAYRKNENMPFFSDSSYFVGINMPISEKDVKAENYPTTSMVAKPGGSSGKDLCDSFGRFASSFGQPGTDDTLRAAQQKVKKGAALKPNKNHHEETPSLKESCMICERGIFQFNPGSDPLSLADRFLLLEQELCEDLGKISTPSLAGFTYNPLEYAFDIHYKFVQRFCDSKKKILFLGMNPGPWGMSQTGVPFGEVKVVRDWMNLSGSVLKPVPENPKRQVNGLDCKRSEVPFGEVKVVRDWMNLSGSVLKPVPENPKRQVNGLDCKRSEVSGSRFWGLFQTLCGTPETFYANCLVYNMCPLSFMTLTGKNITPPQIEARIRSQINQICDKALLQVIKMFKIQTIVAIGKFAYNQANRLLVKSDIPSVKLEMIMHPSPINPAANKGWDRIAKEQLHKLNLVDTITNKEEFWHLP